MNSGLQTTMLVSYVLTPASEFRLMECFSLGHVLNTCHPPYTGFSTIRVYALSPNKKVIPLLTFLLLFVPGMAVLVSSVVLGLLRATSDLQRLYIR